MTEYYYGMRLRGFSPGCQPKEGLIKCLDSKSARFLKRLDGRVYHDVLVYSRPLNPEEQDEYELDYITEM